MPRIPTNIETSELRKGEYVGYGPTAGPWRIKKVFPSRGPEYWRGERYLNGVSTGDILIGSTLREIGEKIDRSAY
jgi:hypothetical protein